MKKIFVLGLALTSSAWACKTPVDPKKAVVFIDTNYSYLEVQAARAAACVRGETFVLLPYGDEFSRKAQAINQVKAPLQAEIDKLEDLDEMTDAQEKRSEVLYSKVEVYEKQLQEMISAQPDYQKALQDKLSQLAASNVAIKAVAISGHNGGGSMHGELGGTDKKQFAEMMHKAYAGKPELESQLDTVLMWGCYTSTPGEVIAWRDEFPKLKILAGFYDSGPSNVRPASFELMKDLLIKSDGIAQKCDEAAMKASIKGLTHIPVTFAAMSVMNKCDAEYYYSRKPIENDNGDVVGTREKFVRFEMNCANDEIDKVKRGLDQRLASYRSGELAIPENTARSPLRTLYSSSRSLQHCIEADSFLNPDRVGLMLFYRGVHENFFKLFADETKQAEKDLQFLLSNVKSEYESYAQNLKASLTTSLGDGSSDFKQATLDRRMLLHLARTMTSTVAIAATGDSSEEKKAAEKRMESYNKKLNRVLFELDPNCMDFLDWHEAKEGHTPKVLCNLETAQ